MRRNSDRPTRQVQHRNRSDTMRQTLSSGYEEVVHIDAAPSPIALPEKGDVRSNKRDRQRGKKRGRTALARPLLYYWFRR